MSYPSPPGGAYPPPPPGYPPGYPPPGYPPGYPPPGYPPGYPPPGAPGYGPPIRPSAPRVFGIISLCLGAVGTLFSGSIALAGFIATSQPGGRKGPEDAPLIAMFLVIVVWSMLLFGVGIGQVRYRYWCLSATWVWSVSGILVAVACVVGFAAIVPEKEPALGFAIMTAFLLPYPVLLMIFFSRAAVKDSLEG